MPDLYMPDVQVEVAFNAGYTTPAASRTWTDVSAYVELSDRIDIGFGRQDERSTADANTLTLTLDNTDGRFTAGRSASTYYPNVKVGRPIRVRVTPPGGTVSTRFVGFIDEWPVEWDGSDRYARARIRAASRLSRLGLNAKLRSAIEQEVLAPGPVAYWTLGDPSGSTSASETSGAGTVGPLTLSAVPSGGGTYTPPTFGNAIGVASDGLTAMDFPENGLPLEVFFPSMTVRSLRLTFLAQSTGTGGFMLTLDGGQSPVPAAQAITLVYNDPADVPANTVYDFGNTGLAGGGATEGVLHDLVVTASAADGNKIYIDGVQVDTDAGQDKTGLRRLRLGSTSQPQAYVFCHVALYDVILTPTQVALQAEAALTGFAGDRTDERVARLLGWAGVPSSEVTAEAGVETMTYQITTGQSVVDALREAESTEGGVLFDDRDGNVAFHNRSHRYTQAAAATLNMQSQHVGADYVPRVDRSTLVNDVEVEHGLTGEKVRAVDTDSGDEYGIATDSVTSLAESSDDFRERADWILASYAEPRTRVPSLTVDVLAHQGLTPSAQTLLGLTIGDLLAVSNAPSQSDTTTPSYFVEGYSEVIGPESYELTFNLSPASPTTDVLILDSATRGLLDTNLLAY